MTIKVDEKIRLLLKEKGGIRLDIGAGQNKQGPNWIGLDIRDIPGITDIVHDVNVHPWPLPDECVSVAVCSHLVEHIPPVMITDQGTRFPFMEFMDEVWRVLKPDGEFAIACPHGASPGFLQDPTHCNSLNETTWAYFDPLEIKTQGMLYRFYRPKPWQIKSLNWEPSANIEVVLVKRREDKSYYE